jgi:hypothetical protein
MYPSIVALGHDSYIWYIRRQQIMEPVDIVYRPGLLAMSLETVNGNDAMIKA